jgi:hypothetical protein
MMNEVSHCGYVYAFDFLYYFMCDHVFMCIYRHDNSFAKTLDDDNHDDDDDDNDNNNHDDDDDDDNDDKDDDDNDDDDNDDGDNGDQDVYLSNFNKAVGYKIYSLHVLSEYIDTAKKGIGIIKTDIYNTLILRCYVFPFRCLRYRQLRYFHLSPVNIYTHIIMHIYIYTYIYIYIYT